MRHRLCYLCGTELDYKDYLKMNSTIKEEQLIVLWSDNKIELLCCKCSKFPEFGYNVIDLKFSGIDKKEISKLRNQLTIKKFLELTKNKQILILITFITCIIYSKSDSSHPSKWDYGEGFIFPPSSIFYKPISFHDILRATTAGEIYYLISDLFITKNDFELLYNKISDISNIQSIKEILHKFMINGKIKNDKDIISLIEKILKHFELSIFSIFKKNIISNDYIFDFLFDFILERL